jgi:hypothetical protein
VWCEMPLEKDLKSTIGKCSGLTKTIKIAAVIYSMMLKQLAEIDRQLDKRGMSQSRDSDVEKDDSVEDITEYDRRDWLASPRDPSKFHVEYTTNDWLKIFRPDVWPQH